MGNEFRHGAGGGLRTTAGWLVGGLEVVSDLWSKKSFGAFGTCRLYELNVL